MSKNRRGAVKLSDLQAGEQTFEALGISPAERSEEGLKSPESSPQGPETVEQVYQGLTDMTEAEKGEIAQVAEVVKGAGPEAEAEAQVSGEQALTELSSAQTEAQASIREVVELPELEAEPRVQMIEGETRVGGMTQEQIQSALAKVLKHEEEITTPEIQARAKQVYDAYYKTHPGVGKSETEEQKALEKDFLEVQKWERTVNDLNTSIQELQEKLEVFEDEAASVSGIHETAREQAPMEHPEETAEQAEIGLELPVDLTRTKTGWQAKPSAGFSRTRNGIRVEPTPGRIAGSPVQEKAGQGPVVQTKETRPSSTNREDLLFNNPELAQKFEALSDSILKVDRMLDKYKNLLRTGRLEQARFDAVIEPLKAEKAGLMQAQDRLLEQAEKDAFSEPTLETGEMEVSKLPMDMQEAVREPDKADKLIDLEEKISAVDAKIAQCDTRYGGGKNSEKYALLMADLQNRRAELQNQLDAARGQESDTSIEYGLTEFSPEEMQTMREEVANKDELPASSEEMVIERTAHSKPEVLAPDTLVESDTLVNADEQTLVEPATLESPSDVVYETAGVLDEDHEADVETVLSAEELAAERDQKDLRYRLKELEEAGPDKWSLAYTGRGLDWSKEQWEKLSQDKKVGEDKSEKQQLFAIHNNLLVSDIRVGGLVSDLKQIKAQINRQEQSGRTSSGSLVMSMQEQMQEAQAQASNLELQTLKARESEILRELRKLEELKKQETAKEKVLFDQTNDLIHVTGTGELPEPASVEKAATIPAAPYFIDSAAVDVPATPDSPGTARLGSAEAAILAAALAAEAGRRGAAHEVAPTLVDSPETISETEVDREFFHGSKALEEQKIKVDKGPGRLRSAAGYVGYGLAGAGLSAAGYVAFGAFKVFQWTTWKAPMKLFKFLMDFSADWGGYFKKKWQALQDFADKPVNDENKERK